MLTADHGVRPGRRRTPTTRGSTRRCSRRSRRAVPAATTAPLADVGASVRELLVGRPAAGRPARLCRVPRGELVRSRRAALDSVPWGHARASRGRDDPPPARAAGRGPRARALEIADPRWCEPLPPEALVDALEGRRVERLGRRGKYLVWQVGRRRHLLMHLRMTGTLLLRPRRRRRRTGRVLIRPRRRPRRCASATRAASGPASSPSARARGRSSRARLGVEPLGPDFTTEHLRSSPGAQRARQGVPARPATRRGRRQHLRRRGAVPRADPPAARRPGG